MTDPLTEFLRQRDAALLALDLEWARRTINRAGVTGPRNKAFEDRHLLVSLHKARVEATSLPDEPRRESARWLLEHGHTRMTGEIPDPDNLPTGVT